MLILSAVLLLSEDNLAGVRSLLSTAFIQWGPTQEVVRLDNKFLYPLSHPRDP